MQANIVWQVMIYDPTTNSLILSVADTYTVPGLCDDNQQTCILKVPLTAAGTQVAAPMDGVQMNPDPSFDEDSVVGTGILPSGEILLAVDLNNSLVRERLWLFDPSTMGTSVFSLNGGYFGAASVSAATYSTVRNEVVILDWLNHFLRYYEPGDTLMAGAVPDTALGSTFRGEWSHFVEIRKPAAPTGASVVEPGETWVVLPAAPNPFRTATAVRFRQPAPGRVTVSVVDAAGRLVRPLLDEVVAPGSRTVTWDGRDAEGSRVAAGVYFVRVRSESGSRTLRVVRLR
jgi:hypothetical protein